MVGRAAIAAVASSGSAVAVGKAATPREVYEPGGLAISAFGENLGGMDARHARRPAVAVVVIGDSLVFLGL